MKRSFFCIICIITFSLILFSCEKDNVEPSDKKITEFTFEPSVNKGLSKKINGSIDEGRSVITISTKEWIDNIESLKPSFKAVGVVKVNNIEQKSAESAQDFRKEVVYVVTAADGTTKSYSVILESPQKSGLPIIRIDTENRQSITSRDNYINATVDVYDSDNKDYCFKATTEIRGRGHSSWGMMPKKPYRLKFNNKTSLFGLPAEKSWVLLANYQDPTLIMNSVAFELGHRFGLPFTNHDNFVELFLNGSYQGNYLITEQVQVKSSRVNISETEGFLIEMDQYYDDEPKFRTDLLDLPMIIKSPDLADYPGLDLTFVSEAINGLESAMFDEAKDFPNNNYKELVDIDNVIDFIMINELMRNVEVKHPKSIYLYKDKNEKIRFGPLWDFDWAFGYEDGWLNYFHFSRAGTMLMRPNYSWDGNIGHKFFCRFFDDPEFRTKYKTRWNEVYPRLGTMDIFMDGLSKKIEKSQKQDFSVWVVQGQNNYQSAINGMISFWNERIKLLNTQINNFE